MSADVIPIDALHRFHWQAYVAARELYGETGNDTDRVRALDALAEFNALFVPRELRAFSKRMMRTTHEER